MYVECTGKMYFFITMAAVGALYFALNIKKVSCIIIIVGLLILLSTYPIIIVGDQNTYFELSQMAYQIATIVFVFEFCFFRRTIKFIFISHLFEAMVEMNGNSAFWNYIFDFCRYVYGNYRLEISKDGRIFNQCGIHNKCLLRY